MKFSKLSGRLKYLFVVFDQNCTQKTDIVKTSRILVKYALTIFSG